MKPIDRPTTTLGSNIQSCLSVTPRSTSFNAAPAAMPVDAYRIGDEFVVQAGGRPAPSGPSDK
ncbi:MAG: hypothetical protein ABJD24_00120 [Acidimicrobiales bacterium]